MTGQLKLTGTLLEQASVTLNNAGNTFYQTGAVSTGADFGDSGVANAAASFAAALSRAAGGAAGAVGTKASMAQHTRDSFAALDAAIAARTGIAAA